MPALTHPLTHPLPRISAPDAQDILATHWGLRGSLRALPGERERNFHVYTDDGREFVLKIASSLETAATIELQVAALEYLAVKVPSAPVPRIVPATNGSGVVPHDVGGEGHTARLLTWLPGRPLAEVSPHSPRLLQGIGESLGSVARALSSFDHPAARRALKWDLAAAGWATEHVHRIRDGAERARVERALDTYTRQVQPALAAARRGIVHNDANDYNILVAWRSDDATRSDDAARGDGDARHANDGPVQRDDSATRGTRSDAGATRSDETARNDSRSHRAEDGTFVPSGLIDYGDLLESHPVCDLAIALAYAMLAKPDPITAACHVAAGYHRSYPLPENEIGLLYPLARTRLAVSLVNAALQAESAPDNEYLQISAGDVSRLLEQLDSVPAKLAEYRLREACGLEPCPTSAAVASWLNANRDSFAPLLGAPFAAADVHVHDFSVGSLTIGSIDDWRDQRRFSNLVEGELSRAGARVGVGRYDEARAIYTTDLFRVDGNDGPEWRTVHVGIDVGAPAGTAIHAPTDGIVHSLRNNDAPGDYGPTVVIEHPATLEHPVFWTLYGHLDHRTLRHLKVGQRVGAGDTIGWLGDVAVNGGWWPHVHVQVICDLLGRHGDFQGVARPNERGVMLSLCPDPTPLLRLPPTSRAPRTANITTLLERRAEHIGPSLSVSYRVPLHIVRGVMQYLIDADGRRYLDAVNNVAHVGHAHPDVVRAGQQQMAALNTNTRYLHEMVLAYAEELTATLPDPLRVCYFVNSGSEANELAIRMARAYSGERDLIVLESGYHGNTTTLVDVSHYKFAGPGGAGAPDWVHVVPMPDTYRGPFREDDDGAGLKYAQAVRESVGTIRQHGRRPAAFLCESILSCGGQVPLPDGYLREAYRHVRAAGGICIADEVQVGLGRVGTHWWAFELHGVVPDIVTMGKPLGNGHPLGAVVTTPDVAARFTNGMEYFNTFGGNPVSCAIGREVLQVIQREGLRERALDTGNYLMSRLRELGERHPLIGDVRGNGLFIGIELVADRQLRTPADAAAGYVANRMRDLGVLLSTDGPDHNVLKIKPPLCFSRSDADFLAATLERVLGESALSM